MCKLSIYPESFQRLAENSAQAGSHPASWFVYRKQKDPK